MQQLLIVVVLIALILGSCFFLRSFLVNRTPPTSQVWIMLGSNESPRFPVADGMHGSVVLGRAASP